MENNQELFKQAILDAKAVRETAMAAARNTLAEHFEPYIKESMRETLSEDDMEENYGMEETNEMPTESTNDMEESTLDQILAELDALSEDMEDGSDMIDGDGISEGQVTTTAGYPEKAGAKHGNKDGSYSEKPGAKKGNTNGSYSEKPKSSIHEGEDDEKEEEDDDAEEAGEDLTQDIEQADDMEGGDEQEVVDITVGDLKDIIRDVFMQIQGGDDMAQEAPLDADTDLAADLGDDELGDEEDGLEPKEISLEEILAELELEEAALPREIPGGQINSKAGDVYKVEEMKKELNEAVKTIKVLRAELNEMNLFNAKMLYVNKIFKAKNLNEAQKTRVINAFDRTTSVKEVENTYKTLLESVGEAKKKTSIKESVGFASKPLGSAPARPIVEADAFVTRWQQLAGIR